MKPTQVHKGKGSIRECHGNVLCEILPGDPYLNVHSRKSYISRTTLFSEKASTLRRAQGKYCGGCRFDSRGAEGGEERADTAQVYEGSAIDGRLVAEEHVDRVDPAQVHKGSIYDSILVAEEHLELTDPMKMHEGRASDGKLVAGKHVELLNPAQVHKCRIRDGRLVAAGHVKRLNPA